MDIEPTFEDLCQLLIDNGFNITIGPEETLAKIEELGNGKIRKQDDRSREDNLR